MDQSKCTNASGNEAVIPVPKRSFTYEFFVGLFSMLALACAAYLAVGLGDVKFMSNDSYELFAEFDNISGLKNGASVEIAGVQVGRVTKLALKNSMALITLQVDNSVQLRSDDIASIRTKGIIGDRYVKISPGASDQFLKPGDVITETESVVDIEDIIGKIVHNFTGEKDEDDKDSKK